MWFWSFMLFEYILLPILIWDIQSHCTSLMPKWFQANLVFYKPHLIWHSLVLFFFVFSLFFFFLTGDYPAPRAVLTGHDHEVVCVSVCAELGLVISGAKGQKHFYYLSLNIFRGFFSGISQTSLNPHMLRLSLRCVVILGESQALFSENCYLLSALKILDTN